jgi:hypothetical protein
MLQFVIDLTDAVSIILTFAFGLNPQAIAFSIQNRTFLAKLHAIFIKLCTNRSLQDDSLFGERPLGRSQLSHLSLLQFFVLSYLLEPLLQISHQFSLVRSITCDLSSEVLSPLLKGSAFSFELLLIGNDLSATLLKFREAMLERFRCGRGLKQNFQSIRFT